MLPKANTDFLPRPIVDFLGSVGATLKPTEGGTILKQGGAETVLTAEQAKAFFDQLSSILKPAAQTVVSGVAKLFGDNPLKDVASNEGIFIDTLYRTLGSPAAAEHLLSIFKPIAAVEVAANQKKREAV